MLSVAVALALFTRFGINSVLSRDEGIYAYGGQQLAHGVPPYVSIFDVKAPVATMVAGLAAWTARLVGRNDLYLIRAAFFACAVLTVLALYLLVARLFASTLAGLTAAVVLSASWPFAADALAGPDAKTPGVLFAVVTMWLMCRRQWFWAALAGALAFLVWQPLALYPFVVVLVALATSREHRWRNGGLAIAGAAVPVLLTAVYYALAGALEELVEATLLFPLTGVERTTETISHRLTRIAGVVDRYYGFGGALFWAGMVALVLVVLVHLARRRRTLGSALAAPVVSAVLVTLLLQVGYAATDFQSYPDLYPLLPYPAIGLGGAVAGLVAALRVSVARALAATAVLAALAVLTVASWVSFTEDPRNDDGLRAQLASACAVRRLQVPGTPVWSMGDPAVLVLTHRTNPDRFVYLTSGVDRWKIAHTPGGFREWTRQVEAAGPSVVVIHSWGGPVRRRMGVWLREHGYQAGFVGKWRVLLTPEAGTRATSQQVKVTSGPTEFAAAPGGRELPWKGCG